MTLPLKLQLALKLSYLFKNPYRIARRHEGVYAYGETPLKTIDHIASTLGIGQRVLDLGCGRGECALYLNSLGHTVIGVDYVDEFIFKAERLVSYFKLQNITFQCRDMRQVQFHGYDTIYFACTCIPESLIAELTPKLSESGAQVITVSTPLNGPFSVDKEIEGKFPWGKTTIYSNRVISSNS